MNPIYLVRSRIHWLAGDKLGPPVFGETEMSTIAKLFLVFAAMLTALGFAYGEIRVVLWVVAALCLLVCVMRRQERPAHAFTRKCPNDGLDAPYERTVRTGTVFVGYVCPKGDWEDVSVAPAMPPPPNKVLLKTRAVCFFSMLVFWLLSAAFAISLVLSTPVSIFGSAALEAPLLTLTFAMGFYIAARFQMRLVTVPLPDGTAEYHGFKRNDTAFGATILYVIFLYGYAFLKSLPLRSPAILWGGLCCLLCPFCVASGADIATILRRQLGLRGPFKYAAAPTVPQS